MNIQAIWTGKYPCLCHGEWKLFIEGKDVSASIPKEKRHSPMDTEGEYSQWYFDNGWEERWDYYTNGFPEEKWCEINADWLSTITPDLEMWKEIYAAFQAEDWRHSSCGGCI